MNLSNFKFTEGDKLVVAGASGTDPAPYVLHSTVIPKARKLRLEVLGQSMGKRISPTHVEIHYKSEKK